MQASPLYTVHRSKRAVCRYMLARGPGRVTFNTYNAQMEYNVNAGYTPIQIPNERGRLVWVVRSRNGGVCHHACQYRGHVTTPRVFRTEEQAAAFAVRMDNLHASMESGNDNLP